PLARGLADQVGRRDEPAVERERERVHTAVAGRAVGLAVERAAAGLLRLELVPVERLLRHDEQRQPLRAELQIGVRPREEREHVGAASERAPRLRAGDEVARLAALLATLGAAADRRDVRAGVRLGDRDADHQLAGGDRWEPLLLL